MPRAMNKHGFVGVQRHGDGRGKPYYCQLHPYRQRRRQTRSFATAKEAFEAGEMLRAIETVDTHCPVTSHNRSQEE